MITIGSRKELAGISDEFKNVWITFIRKFKRTFPGRVIRKKISSEDFSKNLDQLLEYLKILWGEVVTKTKVLTTKEEYNQAKKDFIGLAEEIEELIDILTEIKKKSSQFGSVVTYKQINIYLELATKNITEIKALITVAVASYLRVGRRRFLKTIVKGGAVAVVASIGLGHLSLNYMNLLSRLAKNLPVLKENGLAILISYDIHPNWYEELAFKFKDEFLPAYIARVELAFGQRANVVNGYRTDLEKVSKDGLISGALKRGATRDDLIKVIKDPLIQNIVVFGHGTWTSWVATGDDNVWANDLIGESLPRKKGKLLKHTCGVYRKKWVGKGIKYSKKDWGGGVLEALKVINGRMKDHFEIHVSFRDAYFSYRENNGDLGDGEIYGFIDFKIKGKGRFDFFGFGKTLFESKLSSLDDVPEISDPLLFNLKEIIQHTDDPRAIEDLKNFLHELRFYLKSNCLKLDIDKTPLFGTSVYKENRIYGWDRITSPIDFLFDPFGNKQEDYIYTMAAEEKAKEKAEKSAEEATS
ncbi:hypothetical protein HOE37_02335 [Candidatus Woesearchaeota archaeon]|jgi:hypothetical protein|nr:hypothetical protein [Candidatus Woesearchaeota archaeon]MBT4110671.1 hypothetical protein [Candidatus Woesearchaeota archaeon]MBT4336267.1 hypothetical protein [Candidatus Woesearchaeota archaeon]MBT4469372.1 hypothetical protein [Candidatus Woesearchaeota archaeon]MBT6743805.1 hypothetical protein [Candidatus Woesearchaeota archaeon]